MLVVAAFGCNRDATNAGSSNAAVGGGASPAAGGLSGTVVFVSDNEDEITTSKSGIQIVDIATGQTTRIEQYVGSVWPTADAATWIATRGFKSNATDEEIYLLDASGAVTKTISMPATFRTTPKLSPDRKRIAVGWYDSGNGEYSPDTKLTIFDMQGNILARLGDATGYEWLPDGRLL